jgi:AcrR family transcriptional regulator
VARVAAPRTPKRLPRPVREKQMLDAAVVVFSRQGYHDASMDDIAEAAGISKPMVYAYLGSKETLFVACLHREATRLIEAIAERVRPDTPPDEQLWHGLRAFFGFVAAHRDGWAVLYRQARGQEPFAAEVDAMRGRMADMIAGLLRRADSAAPAEDLSALAYALVGAAESLADWLVDHVDEAPDRTATRMMNLVWLGARQLHNGETWRP